MRICDAKLCENRIASHFAYNSQCSKLCEKLCDFMRLCDTVECPTFSDKLWHKTVQYAIKTSFLIFFLVQKGQKKIEFHNCDLQNVSEHKLRFLNHHSGLAQTMLLSPVKSSLVWIQSFVVHYSRIQSSIVNSFDYQVYSKLDRIFKLDQICGLI